MSDDNPNENPWELIFWIIVVLMMPLMCAVVILGPGS